MTKETLQKAFDIQNNISVCKKNLMFLKGNDKEISVGGMVVHIDNPTIETIIHIIECYSNVRIAELEKEFEQL